MTPTEIAHPFLHGPWAHPFYTRCRTPYRVMMHSAQKCLGSGLWRRCGTRRDSPARIPVGNQDRPSTLMSATRSGPGRPEGTGTLKGYPGPPDRK